VYVRRVLVGRKPQRQLLRTLVERAHDGSAGTLVVRGEPGVGKSALLDELLAGAGQATVLRAQGLEVEAPLAFAALHRLLRPLTRLRPVLVEPQARALRVAFGEEEGPSVEPFLVGVATLSLLTTAAEENLVVCVVDDAHWLDPATAGALLFCARRLGVDRVAMVFAARDGVWGSFDPQGLPEMVLRGLDPGDSRVLLEERLGDVTADEVVKRIVAETGGNPLALLELPGEMTPGQLSGSSPLPSQLHLTAHAEQVFLDRSRRLPPAVQTMLLLAAADDTGELEVLRRAGWDWASAKATSRRHWTQGSSWAAPRRSRCGTRWWVRRSTRPRPVRSGGGCIGPSPGALYGQGDPDREAWHRASAAEGPDQEVVGALELVGARAQRRGGYVAALAAYERAAALCDDYDHRLTRLEELVSPHLHQRDWTRPPHPRDVRPSRS
jgi:hypothetical protein